MPHTQDRKGLALLLLCAVQFMVVLDIAIVNVALPTIKTALSFDETSLSWVINAYTLTFGGLLMLGGRTADLLGRRRMFIAGLALFSGASLVCGLATSEATLIAARAIQGVGAAIISPAALSILTTTFDEGAERNKALGIWGAVAGTGGAAGVLLGGILHRPAELVVDLLHQRPSGHRGDRPRAAHPAREPRRAGPAACSTSSEPRCDGAASRCSYTRWCRPSTTRGRRRAPSPCSSDRPCSSPGSSPPSGAQRLPSCRCASSATARWRAGTWSGSCSGHRSSRCSSCSRSTCSRCWATRRSRPASATCWSPA